MADLLSVPLKKPTEVDLVQPLKNFVASTLNVQNENKDFNDAINELNKLRTNAVWKVFERYESSLEVIYSYYDQINALEQKIPSHEVQIPFKWKDAFHKGSIFGGGRISLTVSTLGYEKVCVLFNIAALQSSIAATQSIESDDGLKLAAKLMQQASGIFSHLKNIVMMAIQQDPTPDLNPETLGALSALMLAQAQEIFVHKAIRDQMKDAVIAKLCCQCEELYAEVLKQLQKESLRQLWDREWIPTVAGKQAGYHAITMYYQSLVCKANKSIGEEISRLQFAMELFKASQQRSGKADQFQDFVNKATKALNDAKKDNDFIYHERIPDEKSLVPVGKAQLAKSIPIPDVMSQRFRDLFSEMMPASVHHALGALNCRKTELVNEEIGKIRSSTQMLNGVLASLNLPAALEDTSGSSLPQSLIEKNDSVRISGGVQQLEAHLRDLPELLQRNKEIITEADRLLNEEASSDNQLRTQFKERWTRSPSNVLTTTFRANISKYQEILNNAVSADKVVREKFDKHRRGMELLSGELSAIQAAVPSAGASSGLHSPAAASLRKLMEDVETIKAERDVLESELTSATVDMKSAFLGALSKDGAINEPAMSVENLGKIFGPLQKQVQESLQRQEALIAEIQVQNNQFCMEKSGIGAAAQREAMLKELAAAFDAFKELENNLKEGTKFYNDLTHLLLIFQSKISDFCFARKTEKEELMKDLTQDMSRQQAGTTPNIPAHHSSADPKKDAPPRPPPPSFTPTPVSQLPYPTQPMQGMPVPYANANAPYPAYAPPPVPSGYNPYAGSPYPTQQGYGYPAYPPAPQYQGYQYPQQQPPPQQNQHPHW